MENCGSVPVVAEGENLPKKIWENTRFSLLNYWAMFIMVLTYWSNKVYNMTKRCPERTNATKIFSKLRTGILKTWRVENDYSQQACKAEKI